MVLPFALAQPDGAPVSLTGSTIWFTVKADPKATDAAAAFQGSTLNGGVQIDDPAGNRGLVIMTASQTAAMAPRAYYWDLQQQDSAGRVTTHDSGILKVTRDITRTPSS